MLVKCIRNECHIFIFYLKQYSIQNLNISCLFQPYKLHKLEKGPATAASLTSEDALKLYEQLATLRRIETASGNLYKEKIIRGFCHLYSGMCIHN